MRETTCQQLKENYGFENDNRAEYPNVEAPQTIGLSVL